MLYSYARETVPTTWEIVYITNLYVYGAEYCYIIESGDMYLACLHAVLVQEYCVNLYV